MASLQEKFEAAVEIIQKLPKEGPVTTSNDQKLEFYSLFKQATLGKATGDRPGIFSIVERKKWDSWNALGDLSQEEAKQKYIDALITMFKKIEEELDVDDWLNNQCDPVIKANLGKIR